MINISVKNIVGLLFVTVFAIVLSTGMFTTIAQAQEFGYVDTWGDNLGYVDTWGDNLGYADTWGDNLGYVDTWGDNLGYVDTWGGLGYVDTWGDNLGYVDTWGDNLGYADSYGDNLGYLDTYGDNLGYVDTYGDVIEDYYGSNPIFAEETYTDEYGVKYSYDSSYDYGYSSSFGSSFSTPGCMSCGGSHSTPPISVRNPSYPSYPPSYPPQQPPRPQPQPPVYTPPSNLTTNTCVNYSCNTSVNNIDNSTNGSFNTNLAPITPVYTTPPQYLVQYVATPPVLTTPVYQNLYCTITASPAYIQNGQAAFLSWTSTGAASAWISDGIGVVAPNGSLTVRPNVSTTYTLTISGYGGTRSCTTYVNVSGTYVSLTQIPYTGFDLGTFGNAMYWVGILTFALASAYLVLYYKGGTMIVASSVFASRSPRVAERSDTSYGSIATPAMFSRDTHRTFAPSVAQTRTLEDLPVARANSSRDSMTLAHSEQGSAPRIVVNRS